jgi:hypothetical protein
MVAKYKALIWILVLAGGSFALYSKVAPARLALLKVAGRASVCPLPNAVEANANRNDQIRLEKEIVAASRVIEKEPAGYRLIDTPGGRWWVPEGGEGLLPALLAEQEREVFGTTEQAPQAGQIALDDGAKLGVWSRAAIGLGAKQVVAFETSPAEIECYRRNLESEIAAGKVVLLEAPLPDIDAAVARLNLPRVDYIKVDTGGSEEQALAGARKTLARFHPKISVAAAHRQDAARDILAVVRAAWPNYSMTCGPCLETRDLHVRPAALYFW